MDSMGHLNEGFQYQYTSLALKNSHQPVGAWFSWVDAASH